MDELVDARYRKLPQMRAGAFILPHAASHVARISPVAIVGDAQHLEGLPVVDELLGDGVLGKLKQGCDKRVVIGIQRRQQQLMLLLGQIPN